MLGLPRRLPLLAGAVFVALTVSSRAAAPPDVTLIKQGPVLSVDALGKGTAPLDGPWQFHIGDDPTWALPQTPDATGSNGWEQLSPGETCGGMGYSASPVFACYHQHRHIVSFPVTAPDIFIIIRRIDDSYAIYWNGQLVGHKGNPPPNPSFPRNPPIQTFGLGPVRDGVLALRVWKAPLQSFDSEQLGGLSFAPVIGSPTAISAEKTEQDYSWLRSRQYYFGLQSIYGLVMVLGLLTWLRNRSQHVLLFIAVFCGAPLASMILTGLRLPFSDNFAIGWLQPVLGIRDVALWFLLLYLLKLDENPRVARLTRILAIAIVISTSLDGALVLVDWSNPAITTPAQMTDGILTAVFTLLEMYPLVLVALALRKRLDAARWLVAITAFFTGMLSVVRIAVSQGARYTHWTIGQTISAPLFTINGNAFIPQTLADTALLLAIIYAVYRYMQEFTRRQSSLEQELKSARELQQILIPETLPELPGFAVTSAYRPAQEVGGDFFQIIPLEGEFAGSTLILLGDVSGKGLKAAMTVSLIVGAARTLAKFAPQPADLLAELNVRLYGRLQGGFTTCLAMRLSPD
jgi:hypothetical protein